MKDVPLVPNSESLANLLGLTRALFEVIRQTPTGDKDQLSVLSSAVAHLKPMLDARDDVLDSDVSQDLIEYVQLKHDGEDYADWIAKYQGLVDDQLGELERQYGKESNSTDRNRIKSPEKPSTNPIDAGSNEDICDCGYRHALRLVDLAKVVLDSVDDVSINDKDQLSRLTRISLALQPALEDYEDYLHPDLGWTVSEAASLKLEEDGTGPTGWVKRHSDEAKAMIQEALPRLRNHINNDDEES